MTMVVDASAILALILGERGAEVVLACARGAALSTVNLIEVLTRSKRSDIEPMAALAQLRRLEIEIVAFSATQAAIAAGIDPGKGRYQLSLADRACLALALDRQATVLTADREWANRQTSLKIQLIR